MPSWKNIPKPVLMYYAGVYLGVIASAGFISVLIHLFADNVLWGLVLVVSPMVAACSVNMVVTYGWQKRSYETEQTITHRRGPFRQSFVTSPRFSSPEVSYDPIEPEHSRGMDLP